MDGWPSCRLQREKKAKEAEMKANEVCWNGMLPALEGWAPSHNPQQSTNQASLSSSLPPSNAIHKLLHLISAISSFDLIPERDCWID